MPWFTLKCRVLLRKKSQTSGSRIKFPIKIPLPSPIWAKRIRLLRHKRDVYFVHIDLRAAQAGISGWLYTGVDVVGVVCVSAFYFEAISLRRRLLIPRSGQIANCCRGMKESQINGLGVPVREIKLILARARLFLMRKVNPERKREREWICVVSRGPVWHKGLRVHSAPDAAGQIAKSKSTSLQLYQVSSESRVAAEKERRPVTSLLFRASTSFSLRVALMADGDLTPHKTTLSLKSAKTKFHVRALRCQRFLCRDKGWVLRTPPPLKIRRTRCWRLLAE